MAKPRDFIDREEEIKLFKKILAGAIPERVLALIIKPQQGKTYLMQCFQEVCHQQRIPVALVDFDTRQRGIVYYWKLARQVCDDLGSDNFPELDECEKRLYSDFPSIVQTGLGRGNTHFGTKGHFEEADFDRISGRDQIDIHDVYYAYFAQEQSAARQERLKHDLGRALRSGLARMCRQHCVVLLLDTYEQANREARSWIDEWVLDPLLDRYPKLVVVIAGRPELYDYLNRSRPWINLVHLREEVSSPREDDIRQYVEIHGLVVPGDEIRSFVKAGMYDISVLGKLRDIYKRCPHG